MFERFTIRARQVVVLARDEARTFAHPKIGREHLLLGLLREEEGIAARVLERHANIVEARMQLIAIVGSGSEPVVGSQIPFTPAAKHMLERALRESLSLGHNYIGTEHILLSLSVEADIAKNSVVARMLNGWGVSPSELRSETMDILMGASRAASGRPSPAAPTPEPEPEPDLLRIQTSSFLGVQASQSWCDYFLWELLLNERPDLRAIVELGTFQGGFSRYLAVQAEARGMAFMTYDAVLPTAAPPPPGYARLDIFSPAGIEHLLSTLAAWEPLILLCDDGNKPRELHTFTGALSPQSLVVAHDWLTEVQPADVPGWLEHVHVDLTDRLGSMSRVLQPKNQRPLAAGSPAG